MPKRLNRQQLYALVWDRPMTQLAKEFGVSDVALHKICRKSRVPTPPPGYWAKKAYGKPVSTTLLPDPDDTSDILIRGSASETEAIAEARSAMAAAIQSAEPETMVPNPIVERTLSKLSKGRRRADGLVRCGGEREVSVAVRPETIDRAGTVLRAFVAAGEAAGLKLAKFDGATAWLFDEEGISFELVEQPDRIEHTATQRELDAVSKWRREREETHRRYGYWQDWGEPHIPKWEQRYQGRLAIRLEEVRIQSEKSPWGETMMRTFADTRTRDVTKMIPRAVATIAAMVAAKKSNRLFELRRRAAQEEARRQYVEAERRRLEDQGAARVLDELLAEQEAARRLRELLRTLGSGGDGDPRFGAFRNWAERRLEQLEDQLGPESIELRLAKAGLFNPAD